MEKKKFNNKAIKHKIIEPYISIDEKCSKLILFLFDKKKPNGVNRRTIKKEFSKIVGIKYNE